jgi:predicted dehydrogenase
MITSFLKSFQSAYTLARGDDASQFTHFAECLEKGTDPHNNLESAFYSHKVIFAVDKSAAEGRPVKLAEFE